MHCWHPGDTKLTMPGKKILREVTREILRWLNYADQGNGGLQPLEAKDLQQAISVWDEVHWVIARQVIFTQGLGAVLYRKIADTEVGSGLPVEFLSWLQSAYLNNKARNTRLYEDLLILLAEANRDGIEVMPLKGILLAQKYYPDIGLRPMADLDLLVRPGDRQRIAAILTKHGYAYIPSPSIYPNHDYYLNTGGELVIDYQGENPDNPRPVEIHVVVRRSMWGDVSTIDLTESLWEGSKGSEISGEHVCLPSRQSLLTHVLLHALQHFLISTGRVIMWLDIAALAPQGTEISSIQYQHLVYPILRLAQRALPGLLGSLDLSESAKNVHPAVSQWCEKVNLDDRCGLVTNSRFINDRLGLFWARWKPSIWRIALGYGNVPLPVAYLKHSAAFIRHIPQRVR